MRGPLSLTLALAATLSLGACSSLPRQLHGDFANVEPYQASTGAVNGYPARWGGIVTGERVSDLGSCVEIAAFPLDKWTQRPIYLFGTKAYQHVELIRPAYFIEGKLQPAPHFLACSDQPLSGSRFYPGAVVTATGTIESPYVFEADPAHCWGQPIRAADYASTPYVEKGGQCFVALPVLKASQLYAWIEPPKNFPGKASTP